MPRSAGDPQGCGKVGQRRERLPRCARAAATRAIAYGATRSDSARLTAPSCAPVLGELRRGKINSDPEISSHNSSLNIPLKFSSVLLGFFTVVRDPFPVSPLTLMSHLTLL